MSTPTLLASTCAAIIATVIFVGCGKSDTTPGGSVEAEAPDTTAIESRDTLRMESAASDTMAGMDGSAGVTGNEETMTEPTNFYEIATPLGSMIVKLYDDTPMHRDNFRKLAHDGFYNGTTFHRVIEGFMIQGGDGNSKDEDPTNDGMGDIGYTIEAEFRPGLIHKRGALAAARQSDQVNPRKRSSGSQFYIVQGTRFTSEQLQDVETQMKERDPSFSISPFAAEVYTEIGGTPFLDGQYTVFGEVVEGFDVLDKIAATGTPRKTGEPSHPALADRPPEAITMTVKPRPAYAAQ